MSTKVVIVMDGGLNCYDVSDDAIIWLRHRGINIDEPIDRHNPHLVECVELFGFRFARRSMYSEYVIEEINAPRYFITCHDGCEEIMVDSDIQWYYVTKE